MVWAVCLMVLCVGMEVFAADGSLQFSDPTVAAGDTVTITAKAFTQGDAIGDVSITVSYDSTMLRFESGTNATGGNGIVELFAAGDGSSDVAAFTMEFTALKQGTTSVSATDYSAYLYSDEILTLTLGESEVTIEGGSDVVGSGADADAMMVQVDGVNYYINSNFSEAAVPRGFEAVNTQMDGKSVRAMYQEISGQYLYYLEDTNGNSDYFLYSTEDGSFSATEIIEIKSDLCIYLMNYEDKEGFLTDFQETTINVGGKVFTAWNKISDSDYYLVYGLSSDGSKGYYQYDILEETYQRYSVSRTNTNSTSVGAFSAKILNFVEEHLMFLMCAVWGTFLFFLILVIVLGVKLAHRNQELDELYEEYDIDVDDDEDEDEDTTRRGKNMPKVSQKSRTQFRGFEEDDEDDFSDFDDEGHLDEDYPEDYVEEEFEDDFDEDDFEDSYSKPKRRSRSKQEDDEDEFSMNFIDL
jgi:hypothetical protein